MDADGDSATYDKCEDRSDCSTYIYVKAKLIQIIKDKEKVPIADENDSTAVKNYVNKRKIKAAEKILTAMPIKSATPHFGTNEVLQEILRKDYPETIWFKSFIDLQDKAETDVAKYGFYSKCG